MPIHHLLEEEATASVVEKAQRLTIEGGVPLEGELAADGAKNAALPLLAATLLTDEPVVLENVPAIRDVQALLQLLAHLGKRVEHLGRGAYRITASGPLRAEAPEELVKPLRASFWVLGPLLARLGRARVPLPGGCFIGPRPVDLHLKGLEALGARIALAGGHVRAQAQELHGAEVHLDYPSVGATWHLLMTAARTPGRTILHNPAQEPEGRDLIALLRRMGARVQIGPTGIVIDGQPQLGGAQHRVMPDRIHAGTLLIAGALTRGDVTVHCEPDHLEALLSKLSGMGHRLTVQAGRVRIRGAERWRAVDIETRPYPGFATDHQPQMTVLLALAEGLSAVRETVYENRFLYTAELVRMGADIRVVGSCALVRGVAHLEGAAVQSDHLQAGAALVLAGLAARGRTVVLDRHLPRGYADLAGTLRRLGARIATAPA